MLQTMAAVLAMSLLVTGCRSTEQRSTVATSSPGVPTLSPLPAPSKPPPTGRLYADIRQSSRDSALGRLEVWIRNDTDRTVTPRRLVYGDDRFGGPQPGTRLREIPARSERGYPVYLVDRPDCVSTAQSGSAVIDLGPRSVRLRVSDETDVVGRYVAARCQELAVARVARLSWADVVPVEGSGPGNLGHLILIIRPTGAPGSLRIDEITGTPLFTAQGQAVWTPHLRVSGTGSPQRLSLPMLPARCDDHVFMESGGATAFRIHLYLNGKPGQVVLRMSPTGAAAAIAFARDSCGKDA